MPIKDQTKVKEYQRLWIDNKRQAQKKPNVEPVEPNKNKYYSAESIKILMSLKEYTELSKDKKKLWLDFAWTLQDYQQGVSDITFIMKLEQVANILIRDYWQTAKQEQKQNKASWNSLTNEQQSKLISYWANEKVRQDKQLLTELEQQEQASHSYLKEIELAKFHEERGKLKCSCYSCEQSKELHKEIKKQVFSYQKPSSNKQQCPDCSKFFKELNEEHGMCSQCVNNYEQ